ncbi:MAG: LPS export ABC transporter periplasmic protein LptC [Candidatus Porifericomitaceae bacterium WSBS_2022_MAG_OTU9]
MVTLPLLVATAMFSREMPEEITGQEANTSHIILDSHGWMEDTTDGYRYRFSGMEMESGIDAETIRINGIWLKTDQENGNSWQAVADSALLNKAEHTILLQGNIALSHGGNHCLRTDDAILYKQERYIHVGSRLRETYHLPGAGNANSKLAGRACGGAASNR